MPRAIGRDSIAIGASRVEASGNSSVSVGRDSWANGDYSASFGYYARSLGLNAIALGVNSSAEASDSLAVGSNAKATETNATALGSGATAGTANSVALGSGATTAAAKATIGGTISGEAFTYAGAAPIGVLSLGSVGKERQITNVAAGQVTGTSTDAVNGSQLFATNTAVDRLGTSVGDFIKGGQIKYFHANSTLADSSATGVDSVAIGSQADAYGEQSLALGAGAVASQATSIALGSSSVTINGAQNGYTAYGLTAPQTSIGELGIGTALGDRKITGVASGSAPNDAVNVAQLASVDDRVKQNTSSITNLGGRVTAIEGNITNNGSINYFHVKSTDADSVASGANSVSIGGNANASGNGAVASGNSAQATGAGAVAVGNGAKSSANGSVAVGQDSNDNGRGAETYSGKYSNASNVSVGTVSVGNTATGQTRTISNVADGQQANDAVNVRQLDGAVAKSKQYTDDSLKTINTNIGNVTGAITAVDSRVTQVENNVSKVQKGTDGMFQVNNTSSVAKPSAIGANALAGGAGSVASGNNSAAVGTNAKASGANSVAMGNGASATGSNSTALGANSVASRDNSVSVGTKGSERQITNVAAATQGTDAVNFDQLNKSVSNITNNVNAYTDQRYSELKRDLKKQDGTLSAGIAGAMAMASLPQPYSPGASMTSIAAANYRGQSALSFGVSRISDNGHWVSKLQATTNTQGDAGVGVGIGYQW
ncbi:cell surface protein (plasmid) [Pseudomonas lurida]|nr:cell surface protein [Pseudomonas lurida]